MDVAARPKSHERLPWMLAAIAVECCVSNTSTDAESLTAISISQISDGKSIAELKK
jgi:hypothetical protein